MHADPVSHSQAAARNKAAVHQRSLFCMCWKIKDRSNKQGERICALTLESSHDPVQPIFYFYQRENMQMLFNIDTQMRA